MVKQSVTFFPATPIVTGQSAARLKWLENTCRSLDIPDRNKLERKRHDYDHILVDDANRVLFCDAPKTGSSLFKTLWLNYTRGVNDIKHIHSQSFLRKHNLRYLSSYKRTDIQTRLKTYFKFLVVRHPLVRVLSAYRDKLEKPNDYYRPLLGQAIERQYGGDPARHSKSNNVTFIQMVRYLIDHGPYDHHWTPVSLLCNPCEIAYDYIARLETSYLDYPHMFSRLKDVPGSKTGLPQSITTYKGATDFAMVKMYYETVPEYYTNRLIKEYNLDFQLFGYTWNRTSKSYGQSINADGKEV